MKNEYDALNRAAVRPEEYAPVPLSGAQQKAQLERLLAGARTKGSAPHTHTGEGPAPAQSRPGARGARRGRKRMAALLVAAALACCALAAGAAGAPSPTA